MRKYLFAVLALMGTGIMQAQKTLTPEALWQVKRVSPVGITDKGDEVVYSVTTPNLEENSFDTQLFVVPLKGGTPTQIEEYSSLIRNSKLSPDGKYELFHKSVHIKDILGKDVYKDLDKSDVYIYDELDYRHWDTWNDGSFKHVFLKDLASGEEIDLLEGEAYYAPQAPFGGAEDYIWAPDGKSVYYVSKKVEGTEYAVSTNTDIYQYDLATKTTENITAENKGYDTNPAFSNKGAMAWLQMETDGYEADKNDIIVLENGVKQNLTAHWDETVLSFLWAENAKDIYFIAPKNGTIQLFKVDHPGRTRKMPSIQQLTDGQFDVNSIVGEYKGGLVVTKTTMNQATELYRYDFKSKELEQLTHENDAFYSTLDKPSVEKRIVKTRDGKDMLVWVVLPPNFDPNKKYPTLLYAQGGPQSPLSQFYSFRWNFQLIASQGYIVVAPNRRGMPGHGVEWNEAISEDWGGHAMNDYLDAIDDVAKEDYVDKDRLGAVGASFGGYSVFYLAGNHEGRFKSFISHNGVFDNRSMYGTTEELFFVNKDMGGAYWEKNNEAAQRTYNEFNPINYVSNWDAPILIIQSIKDFRVPLEQGQQAFQAAQLLGIESRLLIFPEENHWILQPQNAIAWQREFFKWLEKTL